MRPIYWFIRHKIARNTAENNNPFTFVGVIWLIKKRNQTFDKNQIYTWRIQGKDKNKSTPMVLWADSI